MAVIDPFASPTPSVSTGAKSAVTATPKGVVDPFPTPAPAAPLPPPSMSNLNGAPLLAPSPNNTAVPLVPTTPTLQPASLFTIAPKVAPTISAPAAPVSPATPPTPIAPAPTDLPAAPAAPQSTVPIAPAATGKMNLVGDTVGFFGGLAKGFYDMEAHPSADEQTVENALTSAPDTGSPLLNKIAAPIVGTVMAPVKAYLRFVEPMVLPYATDVGQTIGGYQIVQQMNKGQISQEEGGKVLNDLGVMQKTAPQIIGDAMSATLAVITPESAGKILGIGGGEAATAEAATEAADDAGNGRLANAAKGFVRGGTSALPIGGAFGVAQSLQSGSTDPKVIAKIVAQNLAGAFLLGGVTGGLGGGARKPMSIDDAMNMVGDLYTQMKSPELKLLMADTLQNLQDRKAVGSINDSGDLPAPAPDAAGVAAEQPAQAPISEADINGMAKAAGQDEPVPAPEQPKSFLPKVPITMPAGGTVDLTPRVPGNGVTDIKAPPEQPTMFDSVMKKFSDQAQAKRAVVQDVIAPADRISQKAYDETIANGGVTIDAGGDIKDPNAFTPRAGTEFSFSKEQFHPDLITQYVRAHADDLAKGDANLGIWETSDGKYSIAVADKGVYNGDNGNEKAGGSVIDKGQNSGANSGGGSNSGSEIPKDTSNVARESNDSGAKSVSRSNDNGGEAVSGLPKTTAKQPIEAPGETNGGSESTIDANGKTSEPAKPSGTDGSVDKDTQILENKFKDDPQFRGTTFKEQADLYKQLLSENRDKLFDIATEKIKAPEGVVPAAMAELLANDPHLTGEEALRLGETPYATSKAGQALSLSRIGDDNDPVSKIKEVNAANDSKAGTDNDKVKVEADKIKAKVKAPQPRVNWNDFVNSITC